MNSSGDENVEQDNKGRESVRFCLNILTFGFTGGIKKKKNQSRLGKKVSAAIFWIRVGVATFCRK